MKQRLLLIRTTTLLILLCFFLKAGKAQILEKVIVKFKDIQNLSYTTEFKEKEFFGDSIYNGNTKISISLTENKQFAFSTSDIKDLEVFDGYKRINFNLQDSTYRILNDNKILSFNYKLVPNIIAKLSDDLKKGFPITQSKDSIIDGKAYYKIKITERDSIVNNKRTFRFITVLIDKKSFLPFSYRNDSQGFIDGTNTFIEYFCEYHFKNYKINLKSFKPISIEIPKYFSLEQPKVRLPLLDMGTQAPEIQLFDSSEVAFNLANQKGKIVLLNFTLNGCPHCVESVEMLNKLYEKYSSSDFLIVTINPFDSKQSIQKNNKRFDIKYPTYINPIDGKKNVEKYHIQGYPTFYLIDKRGYIVKGFSGYHTSVDEELTGLINKLIEQ